MTRTRHAFTHTPQGGPKPHGRYTPSYSRVIRATYGPGPYASVLPPQSRGEAACRAMPSSGAAKRTASVRCVSQRLRPRKLQRPSLPLTQASLADSALRPFDESILGKTPQQETDLSTSLC